MEYLAKFISESLTEIIIRPDNPEALLKKEKAKLLKMINSNSDDEEIKVQDEIVKKLEKQVENFARLVEDGFVEFVYSDEPETVEGQALELSYTLQKGKVHRNWNIAVDKKHYENKIGVLKKELESSDYKIIKCYEASLVGGTMPYDVVSLTSAREAIRGKINDIEDFVINL